MTVSFFDSAIHDFTFADGVNDSHFAFCVLLQYVGGGPQNVLHSRRHAARVSPARSHSHAQGRVS
jgi:hypothetical protein